MIKFSWKKLNDKFDWNAYSVLEYFFLREEIFPPCYLHRKIPKKVKQAAAQPYEKGPCFIKNIKEVLNGAVCPNELYLYLELASKRSIFDYHMRGVLYLPIVLAEEYQLEWIEINPLLTVENSPIR
jgi:hypothetical protein